MQPPEARIALIDDDEFIHRAVSGAIAEIGGVLVASARTLQEAEALIAELGSTGVNVVLMDANLTEDGREGYGLTQKIQADHPGVHVLSISSSPLMGDILGIPTVSFFGAEPNALRASLAPL
jgi:DNA-binding NarL/FixJ family response regulator